VLLAESLLTSRRLVRKRQAAHKVAAHRRSPELCPSTLARGPDCGGIKHRKCFVSVAKKAHIRSSTQAILLVATILGDSMSCAERTVANDAIIAFLLFCLEIYQVEQQRKRKLH